MCVITYIRIWRQQQIAFRSQYVCLPNTDQTVLMYRSRQFLSNIHPCMIIWEFCRLRNDRAITHIDLLMFVLVWVRNWVLRNGKNVGMLYIIFALITPLFVKYIIIFSDLRNTFFYKCKYVLVRFWKKAINYLFKGFGKTTYQIWRWQSRQQSETVIINLYIHVHVIYSYHILFRIFHLAWSFFSYQRLFMNV